MPEYIKIESPQKKKIRTSNSKMNSIETRKSDKKKSKIRKKVAENSRKKNRK